MASRPSLRARLRYAFDNTLSRGPLALIGWLGLLSLLVVVLAAAIVSLAGVKAGDTERVGFIEAAWLSLVRTLDPGVVGADTGWGFRIVMLGVTLGGIFVISTLIGVMTSGIGVKLEELRKGRSHVLETGHTVILGWSEQVFDIVSELSIANENRPGAAVVILADRDKVAMQDDIRRSVASKAVSKGGATRPMRVVCRTGSPADPADLDIVSVDTSRAIIAVAPEGEPDPDAAIIKAALAITNRPQRRRDPYHIVVELRDEKNVEVLRLIAHDEVEPVVVSDLVARIIAQTCRQPGLSAVYLELLDFAGDEIYFHAEPSLTGQTFRAALDACEDSCVIGIRPAGGAPRINPPMETTIATGDELIFIAADDSAIRLSGKERPPVASDRIVSGGAAGPPKPERALFLGWNHRGPAVLRELDAYVPPGSTVRITAAAAPEGRTGRFGRFANQTVEFVAGETTDRRVLDDIGVPDFDHVIVLASDALEPQQADARTIVTLLHLRDIAERTGARFSIVTEILDERNRALVESRRVEDFIVSKRLVGLILSQISEHKALAAVFADLFDPEGSEVYLKPITSYVTTGTPLDFYTLIEAAARRGEIAIGYRRARSSVDSGARHGVVLNPRKSEPIAFGENDQIIVIAEQ